MSQHPEQVLLDMGSTAGSSSAPSPGSTPSDGSAPAMNAASTPTKP